MFYNRKIFLFVLAIFVCLQPQNLTASKLKTAATAVTAVTTLVSLTKATETTYNALRGDTKTDGSDDAYFGLLLADQILSMGNVDVDSRGEVYINRIHISDIKAGIVDIHQRAQFQGPVFIENGGYAQFNEVILEAIRGGGLIITQDVDIRGRIHIGPDAKFEGNVINVK